MPTPRFITPEITSEINNNFITPVYVYSEKELRERAREFMTFPSAFWHKVRYAMKANPNKTILKIFESEGLYIDASSDFEALRALAAWIDAHKIQISSQELWNNIVSLIGGWVFFVATSLHQLEYFWKNFPQQSCGIRVNPWVSSGWFAKISTGWPSSSFWIWHEYIDEIKTIASKYNITICKLHFHIWSENTPSSWVDSAELGFDIIREIQSVTTFDMWGGHKMAIMPHEKSADLQAIWKAVQKKFEDFYTESGRKIELEMEPGKYLTINSCSMVTKIQDIVNTGTSGYKFLKINSGMNDMPRVAMYWVQEQLFIINDTSEYEEYVVVGHCCESSDILTPKLYDAEILEPRKLKKAFIWDTLVIDWVWAYNSGMAIKNYNSFPESGELLLRENWEIVEIRKREQVEEIWRNEIDVF